MVSKFRSYGARFMRFETGRFFQTVDIPPPLSPNDDYFDNYIRMLSAKLGIVNFEDCLRLYNFFFIFFLSISGFQ